MGPRVPTTTNSSWFLVQAWGLCQRPNRRRSRPLPVHSDVLGRSDKPLLSGCEPGVRVGCKIVRPALPEDPQSPAGADGYTPMHPLRALGALAVPDRGRRPRPQLRGLALALPLNRIAPLARVG